MKDAYQKTNQIYLRFAELEDIEDLYKWRNDEETRKYSFNVDPITYEEHKDWFLNSLSNPKRKIYIIFDKNNKKLGQIRFDKEKDWAEVDITINPEYRGKGIGSLALRKSSQLYINNFKVEQLIAKVKKDNIASLKAFKNANFEIYKSFEDYMELRFKK